MFAHSILFSLALIMLSKMANGQIFDNDRWYIFNPGRSQVMGKDFDGPTVQRVWRTFHGADNCADYCQGWYQRRFRGKQFNGGYCKPSGSDEDRSSWCPPGHTCTCF